MHEIASVAQLMQAEAYILSSSLWILELINSDEQHYLLSFYTDR